MSDRGAFESLLDRLHALQQTTVEVVFFESFENCMADPLTFLSGSCDAKSRCRTRMSEFKWDRPSEISKVDPLVLDRVIAMDGEGVDRLLSFRVARRGKRLRSSPWDFIDGLDNDRKGPLDPIELAPVPL